MTWKRMKAVKFLRMHKNRKNANVLACALQPAWLPVCAA
jgi:hypothetical protein